MSNENPITLDFFKRGNESFVRVTNNNVRINNSKVISFEDYLKITSQYAKDNVALDTGYMPNSLVRIKENSDGSGTLLYYYPSFKTDIKYANSSYYSEFRELRNHPCAFWDIDTSEHLIVFKDYVFKNLIFRYSYKHKSDDIRPSYNVGHMYTPNAFFDNELNHNTKFLRTLFNNHFDTHICWPDNAMGDAAKSILRNAGAPNLHQALNSIIGYYFNSVFNGDLGDSVWNGRISRRIYEKVLEYYADQGADTVFLNFVKHVVSEDDDGDDDRYRWAYSMPAKLVVLKAVYNGSRDLYELFMSEIFDRLYDNYKIDI